MYRIWLLMIFSFYFETQTLRNGFDNYCARKNWSACLQKIVLEWSFGNRLRWKLCLTIRLKFFRRIHIHSFELKVPFGIHSIALNWSGRHIISFEAFRKLESRSYSYHHKHLCKNKQTRSLNRLVCLVLHAHLYAWSNSGRQQVMCKMLNIYSVF